MSGNIKPESAQWMAATTFFMLPQRYPNFEVKISTAVCFSAIDARRWGISEAPRWMCVEVSPRI